MLIQILLDEMKFYSYHGVLPQERKVGNHFVVNLKITVPVDVALVNDSLEDTINYASLYKVVKREMDTPSHLLEHAAGRILSSLKESFPQITAIELKLTKLNPPLGGDVTSASVILSESYAS
ncbi:dihydroneopterin aldolase [Parabacteroides sp. Marseille-P3160]|uniref:dihydroneopterin aldolase n=1 Tax=Parabacteroides sp. Marseille-P3160 TaxID=1917887 RepID=UPI0009BA64DD|nr:dihydroneopterin aldolase [Parabacteroides sp. Marseille-P3160]